MLALWQVGCGERGRGRVSLGVLALRHSEVMQMLRQTEGKAE